MAMIFPYGHSGAAAERVLFWTARSRHTNGTDESDAIDNRQGAADGHNAPMVRDDETAQPGLVCLRHELHGRDMKGGGSVRFVKRQLGGAGLGCIHASDGDRRAGFVNDNGRDSTAKPLRVLMGGLNHRPRYIKRHRSDSRFVLAEERGVDVDRRLVFGGHVNIFEDCVHGTDDLALLAVDTDVWIDIELRCARRGMNARYRADFNAGAIIGAQGGDHVRHGFSFRNK